MIGGAILAAVAIAVVAFLALSGDDDDPTTPLAGESEETRTTDRRRDTDERRRAHRQRRLRRRPARGPHRRHLRGDLRAQPDQAECLAGKMTEAIEDGSLTEEQAFTEVFDYLSDCDISLDEISGN